MANIIEISCGNTADANITTKSIATFEECKAYKESNTLYYDADTTEYFIVTESKVKIKLRILLNSFTPIDKVEAEAIAFLNKFTPDILEKIKAAIAASIIVPVNSINDASEEEPYADPIPARTECLIANDLEIARNLQAQFDFDREAGNINPIPGRVYLDVEADKVYKVVWGSLLGLVAAGFFLDWLLPYFTVFLPSFLSAPLILAAGLATGYYATTNFINNKGFFTNIYNNARQGLQEFSINLSNFNIM